jgi:predicted RecB family nuclease
MRVQKGTIYLSPSDLTRFQSCEHASALDLRFTNGDELHPAQDTADVVLLQKKGLAHEETFLAKLPQDDVVQICRDKDFETAAEQTRDAMRYGAAWIYQGALESGHWQGWSDFMEKKSVPSALGDYSYEVLDTKLKRHAQPQHAVQLSVYSKAAGEIQGKLPANLHVVLGSGEQVTFPVSDARFYTDRLASRLESFVKQPWPTGPEPVNACSRCRWRERCEAHYEETDSLVRVAGITRLQRRRLETAGISTLSALAAFEGRVRRMEPATAAKLVTQARLQLARRSGGNPDIVLKPLEAGRGFCRLPKLSSADLFFDMEGDPLIQDGLEYLFGVFNSEANGKFRAWWAHDSAQECDALKSVLQFFMEHLKKHSGAYIYHYNHYELTALKRLTQKYGVGEALFDNLIKTKRFVDLYRVVQQGLFASEAGYSLKDLEVFYTDKRQGEVATAGESIVAYENWLESKDQSILGAIESYNEFDCRSTKGLRDWLISIRPPEAEWFVPDISEEVPGEIEDPARQELKRALMIARERLGEGVANLLLELNSFYRRADKPGWWEYFDRPLRDRDEFIDDLECLGGLAAASAADGTERTYDFPAQETKLRVGSRSEAIGLKGQVTITSFDRKTRQVCLKFAKKIGSPPDKVDIVPAGPLNKKVLREAVARVTTSLLAGDGRYLAISAFLQRRPPRLRGRKQGADIISGAAVFDEAVAAVKALDDSCLPIQGPPGTGKTFLAARAIVELARKGKRIAVTCNAHKAIDNLLLAVAAQMRTTGTRFVIAKKDKSEDDDLEEAMIVTALDNDDPILHSAAVVGGTAWLFAREEFNQQFDYLFVDEAGQVSIANLVASAAAARNVVLVGDQMQLSQPIQGVHPGESGISCLDYVLQGQRTISPDRGVFLPVSRRMHPVLCSVISDLVYEGRLSSDDGAARHRIEGAGSLPPFGIVFEELVHSGNSQSSMEEATRVVQIFNTLLGARFTNREGKTRKLDLSDILVVSPYNAQVNLIADMLPDGARVGTVDRFQGQEAPACLISMATSSGEELPRDIEFLFSLNRLNVALSRAQALAVLVASPRLLDVSCSTLEELRLVNALCAVRAVGVKP